jgi:hypothetical protein
MLRFGQVDGLRADALDQIDRAGNLAERVGQARLNLADGKPQVASDPRIVERFNVFEQKDIPRLAPEAEHSVRRDLLGVVRIEDAAAPEIRMSPPPPLAGHERPRPA